MSDRSALARCVRDAQAVRIRRTPDRDHARRPRARRVLRQGRAAAERAHRRRDRRIVPSDAHPGRAGQRRRHRAGLSAVRRARLLHPDRRLPAPRRTIPDVQNPGGPTWACAAARRPGRMVGSRRILFAHNRFHAVHRVAGAGPEHLLGRRVPDLLPGCLRRRHHQGRVHSASRRAPLLGCLSLRR